MLPPPPDPWNMSNVRIIRLWYQFCAETSIYLWCPGMRSDVWILTPWWSACMQWRSAICTAVVR